MLAVRKIESVRIWSRTLEKVQRFAQHQALKYPHVTCMALHRALAVPLSMYVLRLTTHYDCLLPIVEAVASAQQAVEQADVICVATSSQVPVLMGEWLAPGSHINVCLAHSHAVSRTLTLSGFLTLCVGCWSMYAQCT
jgi:ornithine cyclodeaminase/alanine dehydrogenase-like protein (mu-crystallin family)